MNQRIGLGRILILFFVLFMAACRDADPEGELTPDPTVLSDSTAETTVATLPDVASGGPADVLADRGSTLARIQDRGYIIAGVMGDYAPLGYRSPAGDLTGFDVDLVQEFAARWLGDRGAVQLVSVTASDRMARLAAGEIDLLAAALPLDQRDDELVDFSQPYFSDRTAILVPSGSAPAELQDLAGGRVAALQGSVAYADLLNEERRPGITLEIIPFLELSPALNALRSGQVTALSGTAAALNRLALDNPDLSVFNPGFEEAVTAIGVMQGDYRMRELVDFTLQSMKRDGTFDAVSQKWFPSEMPFPVETSPEAIDLLALAAAPAAASLAEDAASPASRLETMIERRRVTVGVSGDYQLSGNRSDSGPMGFEVDLIREFARRWFGDEAAVTLVPVTVSDRAPRVSAGELDLVVGALARTSRQEAVIDFSQSYYRDTLSFLVRSGSGIHSAADLSGRRVAVVQGSAAMERIGSDAQGAAGRIEVIPFLEYPSAVEALRAGNVDVVVDVGVLLARTAEVYPDLAVSGALPGDESFGVGLPQGDYRIRELVNFTLQSMQRDGSLDAIRRRWFPESAAVPVPLSAVSASYLPVCIDAACAGPAGELPEVAVLSAIQRIRARDFTVRVGVGIAVPPFSFLNETGEPAGFDIDLARALADAWAAQVEFVPLATPDDLVQALQDGEVDLVMAALSHTVPLDESIDFSQTYVRDQQRLLLRGGEAATRLPALAGRRLVAITSPSDAAETQERLARQEIDVEIQFVADAVEALQAVLDGDRAGIVGSQFVLQLMAAENPELALFPESMGEAALGIGLPSGDSSFRDLVNATLQELKRDGTYDDLYRRWFGVETAPFQLELLPGEWPYTLATAPVSIPDTGSGLDEVFSRGNLTVGVRFDTAPLGFLDVDGVLKGFEVDLLRELGRRWFGREDGVDFVQVTASDSVDRLAAGEIDILAGALSHSQSWEPAVDFSQTYFRDGFSILVRAGGAIESVGELDGQPVGFVQGSTARDALTLILEAQGITVEALPFLDNLSALSALQSGQIDGFIAGSSLANYYVERAPTLTTLGATGATEPYALGVAGFDARFRDLVNFTLQAMERDGTIAALTCTWLGGEPAFALELWPGVPAPEIYAVDLEDVVSIASSCDSEPVEVIVDPDPPLAGIGEYVVVANDSLNSIAEQAYGNRDLWTVIYLANLDKIGANPNLLYRGMRLIIPELP